MQYLNLNTENGLQASYEAFHVYKGCSSKHSGVQVFARYKRFCRSVVLLQMKRERRTEVLMADVSYVGECICGKSFKEDRKM